MTVPLALLAVLAVLFGLLGTPAWPWLQGFLDLQPTTFDFSKLMEGGVPQLMLISSLLVFAGLGLGWWLYGRRPMKHPAGGDPLEFAILKKAFFVDQFYAATVQRLAWWIAVASAWLDRWVWGGIPVAVASLTKGLGWIDFSLDRWVVNKGFDEGCSGVAGSGGLLARIQDGRIQNYLRLLGAAVAVLALILLLGRRG
jgi:NADH-quinone oxidoreductase subunit L